MGICVDSTRLCSQFIYASCLFLCYLLCVAWDKTVVAGHWRLFFLISFFLSESPTKQNRMSRWDRDKVSMNFKEVKKIAMLYSIGFCNEQRLQEGYRHRWNCALKFTAHMISVASCNKRFERRQLFLKDWNQIHWERAGNVVNTCRDTCTITPSDRRHCRKTLIPLLLCVLCVILFSVTIALRWANVQPSLSVYSFSRCLPAARLLKCR